jgi:hypothetical protein
MNARYNHHRIKKKAQCRWRSGDTDAMVLKSSIRVDNNLANYARLEDVIT